MANRVRTLVLADEQRVRLRRQVRAKGLPARAVERARIVLLAAEGVPGVEIAEIGPPATGAFTTSDACPSG